MLKKKINNFELLVARKNKTKSKSPFMDIIQSIAKAIVLAVIIRMFVFGAVLHP